MKVYIVMKSHTDEGYPPEITIESVYWNFKDAADASIHSGYDVFCDWCEREHLDPASYQGDGSIRIIHEDEEKGFIVISGVHEEDECWVDEYVVHGGTI